MVREYTYGNAIVVIHRPKLSDKEKEKQEAQILRALQHIGKEMKENEHGNGNQS